MQLQAKITPKHIKCNKTVAKLAQNLFTISSHHTEYDNDSR